MGMGPNIGEFANMGFGTEIVYSFVIILCSLLVYFGTRELYELSSHKGIKYFRLSFLFFAISYFFRSFIKFIVHYFNVGCVSEFLPGFYGAVTLFLFMYFSSIAIFYLLYSVMWKKWNGKQGKIYLFHLLAFVISLACVIFRDPFIHLAINVLLLIFIGVILYVARSHSRKRSHLGNLYAIYGLLFVFWLLKIIDILVPRFLYPFQLFIYLASIGVFLMILYKVIKKTGSS